MDSSWKDRVKEELAKPYMRELADFLQNERSEGVVYPPVEEVFSAFSLTPYESVKVVIMGQDPYHGPGQAHGLSFSVPKGVSLPPSLKNVYKEIERDLGFVPGEHGFLASWAKQGVFLLNAILTVRAGQPKSHHGKGWESFTDHVVDLLIEKKEPVIFLLWGKSAQEKGSKLASHPYHRVLTAAHPSPYSAANFLGCRHFSKVNAWLIEQGKLPIDWKLSL